MQYRLANRSRQIARIGGLLALLACAGPASAQYRNIPRDQMRLQTEQRECRMRFARVVEQPRRPCTGTCRSRAEANRDRCLARAQTRYERALREALGPYGR